MAIVACNVHYPYLWVPAARGAVCVRGHPDHWEYHDCNHTPAIHVCLHWRAALQGEKKRWSEAQAQVKVGMKGEPA